MTRSGAVVALLALLSTGCTVTASGTGGPADPVGVTYAQIYAAPCVGLDPTQLGDLGLEPPGQGLTRPGAAQCTWLGPAGPVTVGIEPGVDRAAMLLADGDGVREITIRGRPAVESGCGIVLQVDDGSVSVAVEGGPADDDTRCRTATATADAVLRNLRATVPAGSPEPPPLPTATGRWAERPCDALPAPLVTAAVGPGAAGTEVSDALGGAGCLWSRPPLTLVLTVDLVFDRTELIRYATGARPLQIGDRTAAEVLTGTSCLISFGPATDQSVQVYVDDPAQGSENACLRARPVAEALAAG